MASATASSSVSSRVGASDCSMVCRAGPASLTARAGLADFAGLDVELEMNPGVERPVGLLWLVLEIDLGKRQAHGLRRRLSGGAAVCHAGDDDVFHLDAEELLLGLPCYSVGDTCCL